MNILKSIWVCVIYFLFILTVLLIILNDIDDDMKDLLEQIEKLNIKKFNDDLNEAFAGM